MRKYNNISLEGSFSVVSKLIFTGLYSFISIFSDLQDLRTSAPLQSQSFRKIENIFATFSQSVDMDQHLRNFDR